MTQLTENVFERFKNSYNKGQISMSDSVKILEFLFKELNLKDITTAAKVNNISYNGMKKRINAGKEAYLTISGQKFIL